MRFADYIVLYSESIKEVNLWLEEGREVLKGKGLRSHKGKTEYKNYDFEKGNTDQIGKDKL